jgi:hypothetical protein
VSHTCAGGCYECQQRKRLALAILESRMRQTVAQALAVMISEGRVPSQGRGDEGPTES